MPTSIIFSKLIVNSGEDLDLLAKVSLGIDRWLSQLAEICLNKQSSLNQFKVKYVALCDLFSSSLPI